MGKWTVEATTEEDAAVIGSIENGDGGTINIDISGEVSTDAAERIRSKLAAAIHQAQSS